MLSRNTLLYGTSEAPAPLLGLNAGPLSLYFQNGDLRYITCAGREVLRRAYAVCVIRIGEQYREGCIN